MIDAPVRVLLVEDNPADAHLLKKFLSTVEPVELIHVECLQEAIERLHEISFDAVLLDLYLPDSFGLDTVKKIHQADREMPILVMTGLDDEEVAITALREGAQDYLVKGQIHSTWLIKAIRYAIERQQTLDKLQHLNAELARSNDELEQFAHVVSHDLQQPLQVIYGFARILELSYRDLPDDEPVNQHIAHIVKASRHMSQLIQDLLAYSKVGQPEPLAKPTDCNEVIEKVLFDLQRMIQSCRATITINELPTVNIGKTHLGQLFQNLLTNALKYHLPDQAPQVTVSAEKTGTLWRFCIHDNGIGIQPENAQKVFQIFQRLHTKQEYSGTGIGLSTCKKIVEKHGGEIWIDLKTTEGTTFFFTLPALSKT